MEFWVDEKKGESVLRVWDQLTLGGITFPGLWMLEANSKLEITPNKYLLKAARGTTPAQYQITLSDQGYVPSTIKATGQIWTKEQWEDLEETLPKFTPRSGNKQGSQIGTSEADVGESAGALSLSPNAKRKPNVKGRDAFEIIHPACALLGLDAVIVTEVILPPIVGQTLTVQMNMIQYFPQTGKRNLYSSGGDLSPEDFDVPPVDPDKNL